MKEHSLTIRYLEGYPQYLPSKIRPKDVGLDVHSAVQITIKPGESQLVETGLIVEPPKGHFIALVGRSGLAAKHGIFLLNGIGIVDPDYCGESDSIRACLANFSREQFEITPGMRIAQLLCLPYRNITSVTADMVPEVKDSRGGFGSTGLT